jgi:hypothetical protein
LNTIELVKFPVNTETEISTTNTNSIHFSVHLFKETGSFLHIPIRTDPFDQYRFPQEIYLYGFIPFGRSDADADSSFQSKLLW